MTRTARLRLYLNPKWRREGVHTMLLNPWWGNPYAKTSFFPKQMFDAYVPDTTYYTITEDIQTADMVLVPYPHAWFQRHGDTLLRECAQRASEARLPILVDGMGDREQPLPIENAYILRYGGYRFLPERGSIQAPLLTNDLLVCYRDGQFEQRKKGIEKPIVGFAGWAKLSPKQYVRTLCKEVPVRLRGMFDPRYRACTKGVLWRQKAIQVLERSPQITLNLRRRSSFSANTHTAEGDMKTLQEEMVNTILESDYALDVRGDANNSARLFEILSLGRIPVIIDTERNFPFSNKINYDSFAIIVDFRELDSLPERIIQFHSTISPERFIEMQNNARQAYLRYFRIDAVMRPIVEELRAKISQAHSVS